MSHRTLPKQQEDVLLTAHLEGYITDVFMFPDFELWNTTLPELEETKNEIIFSFHLPFKFHNVIVNCGTIIGTRYYLLLSHLFCMARRIGYGGS